MNIVICDNCYEVFGRGNTHNTAARSAAHQIDGYTQDDGLIIANEIEAGNLTCDCSGTLVFLSCSKAELLILGGMKQIVKRLANLEVDFEDRDKPKNPTNPEIG